jgi:hypothetical protein
VTGAVVHTALTRRGREQAREVWTGRRADQLSAEEHLVGHEPDDAGIYLVGRDPRQMTQDELRAMGQVPMSPMAAIRSKCLDCCAGAPSEVRRCSAVACSNWPFRTGKNPWRLPVSEAKREAGRRQAEYLRRKSQNSSTDLEDSAGKGGGRYCPICAAFIAPRSRKNTRSTGARSKGSTVTPAT